MRTNLTLGRFLRNLNKNSSDAIQDTNVSLAFPLKQARENFEKKLPFESIKKIKEMYLKLRNS